MHPNPAFRQTETARNIAFAQDRGFGVLTINGQAGPLASHVPFRLADDGQSAELHLVRSNPILRTLSKPQPALIAVSGPDGYISPDWYDATDQVPTWNYVAVHLRGQLEILSQAAMRGHLDRLSELFETRLASKTPWHTQKMTPEVLDRMMRAIMPCRLIIDDIQGTWKLNQNKEPGARITAASHVYQSDIGQEIHMLAALMRDADK